MSEMWETELWPTCCRVSGHRLRRRLVAAPILLPNLNRLVTLTRYTCSAESPRFTGAKLRLSAEGVWVKLVRSTRGCVTDWQQETRSLMF